MRRDLDIIEKVQHTYEKRFGPEVYAEIKRIREWLSRQPQRAALLAYLSETDRDPK